MSPTAVVVGSGPNGLAAAIVLAQAGYKVQVREACAVAGGATRSAELTLPGFLHDLGSAVHPLAVASPFFSALHLENYGLNWAWPSAELAHPLEDGSAITLERSVADTASQLGKDAQAYRRIFTPLVAEWAELRETAFQPLRWPKHPFAMARFGLRGIRSAEAFTRSNFQGGRASALFAGLAAHSILPLDSAMTAAMGLMLGVTAHAVGWPVPQGGAQTISESLLRILEAAGGEVITGSRVGSLQELGELGGSEWSGPEVGRPDLILLDITPKQLLELGGEALPPGYRGSLERFQYGPGVFKVDWALSQPIPWRAKECLRAATVHLGASFEEIAASERAAWQAEPSDRPFILLAQPTLFDPSRAPMGRHTAWAYCHVPNGWRGSALAAIEAQIERFAPGFRECVLARSVCGTKEMEAWDENLVGGDINGGSFRGLQFFVRPGWRRYGTPLKGVYLCSSSTPPGGGVHGMCGYWAAHRAIRDHAGGRGLRAH